MEIVEMAARFEANAETVWSLVGDFAGERLTGGYVERVEIAGRGSGALRTYHLAQALGGGAVVERLERLCERDRVLEYSMIDNGPVPWTGYRGRIAVTAAGPDACVVMLRTEFFPVGAPPETCIALSRENIGKYFENIRAIVEPAAGA